MPRTHRQRRSESDNLSSGHASLPRCTHSARGGSRRRSSCSLLPSCERSTASRSCATNASPRKNHGAGSLLLEAWTGHVTSRQLSGVSSAVRQRRRACSLDFRPIPSKRVDCRSPADRGVRPCGGVTVEMDEKDRRRTSRRSDDRFVRRCRSRLRVGPSTSFAASAYAAGRAFLREHPPPANSRRGAFAQTSGLRAETRRGCSGREGIVI
jgi:hypothetical protein